RPEPRRRRENRQDSWAGCSRPGAYRAHRIDVGPRRLAGNPEVAGRFSSATASDLHRPRRACGHGSAASVRTGEARVGDENAGASGESQSLTRVAVRCRLPARAQSQIGVGLGTRRPRQPERIADSEQRHVSIYNIAMTLKHVSQALCVGMAVGAMGACGGKSTDGTPGAGSQPSSGQPAAASPPGSPPADNRKYLIERVDDAAVVQLYADGFEKLPLDEKTLIWHLYEAALAGRDIYYDQRYAHNLEMRDVLEEILTHPGGIDADTLAEIQRYTKLFWLNTGPYNNLTARKFVLKCSPASFAAAAATAAKAGANFPLMNGESLDAMLARMQPFFFDAAVDPIVTNKTP